jgi:heme/copper-type cytochrome/quinol oxidase subunit 2
MMKPAALLYEDLSWHHHSSMGTASIAALSFYVLQKNIQSATKSFSKNNSDNRYKKDEPVKILLIAIAILALIVILWAVKSRKQAAEKTETYVCDQCGETDCECRKET